MNKYTTCTKERQNCCKKEKFILKVKLTPVGRFTKVPVLENVRAVDGDKKPIRTTDELLAQFTVTQHK